MIDTAGPHFVLSGYRDGTSPRNQGTFGHYWSSSAYTSDTNAYYLSLNGALSTVNPSNNSIKRFGFSVRCVFGS